MRLKAIAFLLLCLPLGALAQEAEPFSDPYQDFARAKVLEIINETQDNDYGFERVVQTVRLRVMSGQYEGQEFTLENGILNGRADMTLAEGETVVVERLRKPDGSTDWLIREKYRLPALLWLIILFFIAAIVLGGRTGAFSVIGLAVSILILALFIVPRIVAGQNPLLISSLGAAFIACTSLYLAHGFKKRTTVALISTLITLALSVIVALLFVSAAKLFGMGSEEAVFLQLGPLQVVNLRGLLLGGIVIGALGVLDDITTAQTAAIDELSRANPRYNFQKLYGAGVSIGREHIASLINTLALAYVGASLPLLLLFTINQDTPPWMILNSEFIAEEIVRTLVGSLTLLLAVPISTFLAAWFFQHGHSTGEDGHLHLH